LGRVAAVDAVRRWWRDRTKVTGSFYALTRSALGHRSGFAGVIIVVVIIVIIIVVVIVVIIVAAARGRGRRVVIVFVIVVVVVVIVVARVGRRWSSRGRDAIGLDSLHGRRNGRGTILAVGQVIVVGHRRQQRDGVRPVLVGRRRVVYASTVVIVDARHCGAVAARPVVRRVIGR